ncbi:homoserine dehydrogenase [Hydrogenoanaerobacterium saccharovorans]|uniref:Homoserine dehydrogenase n=1 Tax=Hydrogenoanaerobacterium saccharovorans TaxID=474960 RepID=A0A1H8ACI5_9FIRM|nr:homoserine dehydrogenase [Hydrogenoanaerobacterium saccharovorans]RPF48019.1 homoserine dehydrogenase [Hydrogenoanaerobacterium saccharovorans]SEM68485.1 homoserine dehydrogenase [Hydrogenoanaerobacterium saccharovorans]
MLKIAVMGHGVVGSGVLEVFYKNRASMQRKANKEMDIKYVLDLRDFPGLPYSDKFIKDFELIVNDPEINIVVEVMGGLNPAFTYVKRCLEAGKSVVTSNKELVAAKGAELLKIANDHDVNFFFEASVGGGIPIIRPLHACLVANEIDEIAGILNGTTNFILTKMIREQMTFSDALALAQKLGYAERNPAADVEGHDACRKICILASLAFGKHVYPDEVYTDGITKLTLEDVEYAKNWGGVIKLIGRAKRMPNGKVSVMVSPAFISSDSQLSSVDDVFNAVLVRGDATGDVVFYGKGAGKLPTASAVVADVVDAAKAEHSSTSLRWENNPQHNTAVNYLDTKASMYVRIGYDNYDKAIKVINDLFGEIVPIYRSGAEDEFAFITPILTERELSEKIKQITQNGLQVLGSVRVLDY